MKFKEFQEKLKKYTKHVNIPKIDKGLRKKTAFKKPKAMKPTYNIRNQRGIGRSYEPIWDPNRKGLFFK